MKENQREEKPAGAKEPKDLTTENDERNCGKKNNSIEYPYTFICIWVYEHVYMCTYMYIYIYIYVFKCFNIYVSDML
jgi:hypothetical protein